MEDKNPSSTMLDKVLRFIGLDTDATMSQRVERLVFLGAAGLLYYAWEKRDTVVPKLVGDDRVGLAAGAGVALLVLVRLVAWAAKRFDRCEQESLRLRESLKQVTADLAGATSRMSLLERLLFPGVPEPTDADWVSLMSSFTKTGRRP